MQKNNRNNVYIEITVTNACNCNCSYCFENDKRLCSSKIEEERQLNLLKKYCETFDKEKHSGIILAFWGGEPLVNSEYLYKLIESTYKYDFVYYQIYSNGTLCEKWDEFINKEWFKEIKDRFEIQFSYDGEPHHSLMRGYTADNIFKTVDNLLSHDIKVSFKATLTMKHLDLLPQIWDSYEELYERYPSLDINYAPTLDTSDNENLYLDIWKKSLIEILPKELKFIQKHGRPLWIWFRNGVKINCNLNNRIHINTDGKIYICHGCPYFDGSNKFVINTTDKINDLSEVIKYYHSNDLITECSKCDSTYCSICHALVNKDEDNVDGMIKNWAIKRNKLTNKCKYYKLFGYMSRVLKVSVLKTMGVKIYG